MLNVSISGLRSHNPLNTALYRPDIDTCSKSVDDIHCIVQTYVLLKVTQSGFDNDVSIRLTSIET